VDAAWDVGPGPPPGHDGRYGDAYDGDPYGRGHGNANAGGPRGGYGDEFDRGGYPSYDPYGNADPYGQQQQPPGQGRPRDGSQRPPQRELSDGSNSPQSVITGPRALRNA
jgi:hypothetical protein